ncbi:hypothetical protein BDA96_07G199000 [Sorghum bicolor]|uniref:Uncharacterized protein n=2 Tax=Sorghum bicolor TaxID=4558 RepID=A0A921QLP2_SORBI|nr:PP2A regulatory subunit TAP46 isoform X1 [Sorghum bicolor]XP_021320542.1 PP2A regulatory subunit TAP46 isoform X1 [Sorghum bicolor]XP_021320543.1 PP2A regulatory subunit TAP46 isoform X1 [Sorghum bicolor]XP_021320544.1 PP2A regulatory subunit TAP46 isoform X1 [Sorghum bicolor]XP_021320545.1 PP2A regulatory subunit TAP46 isoform X1 [Sorghum bicolor]KAG0524299.1 hypothetical protein BDA96_07G199000 [Sorghum bicolor]KXG25489.1 hypothetical protein SORBI_3007G186900 [Sorghum bicolor]|eukprot:XP_021320541.1 PP2A regulatory subunit TAP46 isoform X1 [Sorghum bicolor]
MRSVLSEKTSYRSWRGSSHLVISNNRSVLGILFRQKTSFYKLILRTIINCDNIKEFIALCEVLELIPEDELELSRQKQPDTMANRRAQKVARFKRQKAAETKLQEIRERKERRGRSLRAAALSAPIEAGEEDDLEDDGEEEREAWLATISLALCKAFDLLDMLKKEEEMLLAVKERKAKVWYDHLAVVLPLRDATLETSSGVNILFVLTSSARTYTYLHGKLFQWLLIKQYTG